MDRTERFYKIDQMLHDRSVVPLGDFLEELGTSLATFKRDLEYMRERLYAPIVWDREVGAYRFDQPDRHAPSYALPGLWFNASEVHALLSMQHLLSNLDAGMLASQIKPLQARLKALLGSTDHTAEEVEKRLRIVQAAKRTVSSKFFETIASATLGRKQIKLRHYSRQTGGDSERLVSPQLLTYYRDNWYLDAWCHLRNDIRRFAIDAILHAELTGEKAQDVPKSQLKEVLESGYGIFSGSKVKWASLRFTPERARWVATEQWHSQQKGSIEPDGSYLLEIPYTDDRELLMDILKYGGDVEVIAPLDLRQRVQAEISRMGQKYLP
ncbi:MAG TPA: YafY family protein [Gallionella sp.]|jgi:predicted DNA-binding transcriptional regulator YafY|nr:YafY family protein [Gallionella sp.]